MTSADFRPGTAYRSAAGPCSGRTHRTTWTTSGGPHSPPPAPGWCSTFRPGIRDWIAAARELGLTVAIASSSPRPWVRGHLERVDAIDLFDLVVTGDEVATHKPDPAIYELALRRIGVPGSQAIAVEDTAHGVAAAQAAGMFAVAIPNPFVTAGAVAAADLVLGSADQLSLSDLLLSAGTTTATDI